MPGKMCSLGGLPNDSELVEHGVAELGLRHHDVHGAHEDADEGQVPGHLVMAPARKALDLGGEGIPAAGLKTVSKGGPHLVSRPNSRSPYISWYHLLCRV